MYEQENTKSVKSAHLLSLLCKIPHSKWRIFATKIKVWITHFGRTPFQQFIYDTLVSSIASLVTQCRLQIWSFRRMGRRSLSFSWFLPHIRVSSGGSALSHCRTISSSQDICHSQHEKTYEASEGNDKHWWFPSV